ncbi:MAG TPA: C40 family peptidase [Terracidiphilus sp.]|nr:C40 family peptidase [Terracidiphilus sp.]
MKEPLLRLGFALTASIAAVAATAAQQTVPNADFVVARPVVNMYHNASAMSDVVSQALYGTGVLTLSRDGDFYNIRTADDYTGWVKAADLRPLNGKTYAGEGQAVHVTSLSANVYREPDTTTHAPLLNLPWESRLELVDGKIDATKRWLQVRLVSGDLAWIQQGDVSAQTKVLSIDAMLQLARRFIGVTYTWGGVSSFGYDCSGFMQMLERQRGIEMPRDASVQAKWSGGVPVDRKDLEPGDLLYFGSRPEHITHTGMYLGNGEFINDTPRGHPGVQIDRLDDMPWTQLFVTARRVKP